MPKFRIKPFNGHHIFGSNRNAKIVVHWAVYVINKLSNDWIFLKAFYTEKRAQDFIEALKESIAKGDYSCLTLKN